MVATSHSARTRAHSAAQSSNQKRSDRASGKLAQLASEAFSAGLPKRSQPLRRSTLQAGSDVEDEDPWCVMARKMACCACCRANLVAERTRMSAHGNELNHWESMISSSWRNASLSNSRSSSSGACVELASCGTWMGKTTSAPAAGLSTLFRRRMRVSLAWLSVETLGTSSWSRPMPPRFALGVYVRSLLVTVTHCCKGGSAWRDLLSAHRTWGTFALHRRVAMSWVLARGVAGAESMSTSSARLIR